MKLTYQSVCMYFLPFECCNSRSCRSYVPALFNGISNLIHLYIAFTPILCAVGMFSLQFRVSHFASVLIKCWLQNVSLTFHSQGIILTGNWWNGINFLLERAVAWAASTWDVTHWAHHNHLRSHAPLAHIISAFSHLLNHIWKQPNGAQKVRHWVLS